MQGKSPHKVPVTPPLVDPVHEFALFTNAKCGGTSLKPWFFANLGLPQLDHRPIALMATFGPRYALQHLRLGRRLLAAVESAAQSDAAYRIALQRLGGFYRQAYGGPVMRSSRAAGFFRICVTRDPYARVVSAYLDKFCGDSRGNRWAMAVVDRAGRDGGITFDQFLGYLETTADDECNPHWRRQTYNLEGHRIDAFVRLEQLESEMSALADIVGAEHLSMLGRRLKQGAAVKDAKADVTDLTEVHSMTIAAGREAAGGLPDPACFLTTRAKERIRAIYAADFDRLPYTP
jgi:hypothetical protein